MKIRNAALSIVVAALVQAPSASGHHQPKVESNSTKKALEKQAWDLELEAARYFAAKDYSKAVTMFLRAEKIFNSVDLQQGLANALFHAKRYAELERRGMLIDSLSCSPNSNARNEVLKWATIAAWRLDHHQTALEYLLRTTWNNQERAELLQAIGQPEVCITLLEARANGKSIESTALRRNKLLTAGHLYLSCGKISEAQRCLSAAEEPKRDVDTARLKCRLIAIGNRHDEIQKAFAEWRQISKNDAAELKEINATEARILSAMSSEAQRDKRFKDALVLAEKASSLAPSDNNFTSLASGYYALKDFEKSALYAERAFRMNRKNMHAALIAGVSFGALGSPNKAVGYLNLASADPAYLRRALQARCAMHLINGEVDEAESDLLLLQSKFPQVHYTMEVIKRQCRDYTRDFTTLFRVLWASPTGEKQRKLLAMQNSSDESFASNPKLLVTRGRLHLELRQFASARSDAEKAIKLGYNNLESHELLAAALSGLNLEALAYKERQTVIALFAQHSNGNKN